MANVTNLNRYRKQKAKAQAAQQAAANRLHHGRSKQAKQAARALAAAAAAKLEGHRLPPVCTSAERLTPAPVSEQVADAGHRSDGD